jgi:hypothetical protein
VAAVRRDVLLTPELRETGLHACFIRGAGYTTLDFALKLDQRATPDSVSIVRMIKQRACFAGWLNMKVHAKYTAFAHCTCSSSPAVECHVRERVVLCTPPAVWLQPWWLLQVLKFAGFRRVWEQRYCLITPRRHNQRIHPNNTATFTLLTWFRAQNDFNVCGKVCATGQCALYPRLVHMPATTACCTLPPGLSTARPTAAGVAEQCGGGVGAAGFSAGAGTHPAAVRLHNHVSLMTFLFVRRVNAEMCCY